ncbi:MAG: type II secretion system protein GspL [Rhodospirillaceae bacterium]|nr:type II secretion system protein GspL [Rhodospirillaceae bacterium]
MTATRILVFDAALGVIWGLFENGTLVASGEGLATPPSSNDAATRSHGAPGPLRTWVVVPGQDVLLRTVDLPPGAGTKLDVTLPFLLEDDLATGPEALHFALGRRATGTSHLVGATAAAKVEFWLDTLGASGVAPDAMIPDALAFPAHTDRAVIVVRDLSATLTLPDGPGFTVDTDLMSDVFPAILEQHGVARVDLLGEAKHASSFRLPQTIQLHVERRHLRNDEIFAAVYARLSLGIDLNLLQGRFAVRRAWAMDVAPWRRAAALLAVFAGLAAAQQITSAWSSNAAAQRAMIDADRIARETLPPSTRLVNARAQLKAHAALLRAESADEFLAASEILGQSLAEVRDGSLDSLTFDRAGGTLTASVLLPTFDDIVKLKAAVAERNGILVDGEARQTEDGVTSSVTVRLP